MKRKGSGQVPGVNDAELVAVLQGLASVPETSVDSADRFAAEVRAIVEDRAQRHWTGEGDSDVAVFLHTPYPREVGGKIGAAPVSNLIASGKPILGKLFFLNPDASYGQVIDLPVEADRIIDWLIERNLGDQPLVFAYRDSRRLLARGRGAEGEITRKETIRDYPPAVTLQEIGDALTHTHRQHLITPAVCPPNVWAKGMPAKYVPGSEPEKAIQRQLGTDLRSWFRGAVRAEFEPPIPLGRIDIRLLHLRDGAWTFWAILELKVLRSSHHALKGQKASAFSLAENVAAIAEGVRQVNAFAKHCYAEPLLEIFDLRKDKRPNILEEQLVTQELAKCQPAPSCRTWPLFGSASDARRAGFQ